MRSFGIVGPFVSLAGLALVQGCVAPTDDEAAEAEALGSQSQELYYESLWPKNVIDVCWETTPPAEARERLWVRQQVTKAYETETGVQFMGWEQCTSTSKGVRIRVADELPGTTHLGVLLNGKPGGMTLNFDFTYIDPQNGIQPFSHCIGNEESCIRSIAVHEFGHALGYMDYVCEGYLPCSATHHLVLAEHDPQSVMSWCNVSDNGGVLSSTDLAATKAQYGLRQYRPKFVLADFGAKAGGWSVDKHVRLSGDVNGDKRSDIVGFGDAGVYSALSTGTGFKPSTLVVADFGYNQGWRVDRHLRLLGDLNGDRKQDIIGFGDDGISVSYATAEGFSVPEFVLTEFGFNQGWRIDKHPRMLGDVNKDGRQDIVGFSNDGIWVAYATATGFSPPVLAVADLGYNQGWRTGTHPRFVADVNADGRQDVVGFGQDGVWVSLATKTGLSPAAFWLEGFAPNAGGWLDRHPRFMADVNGDKRSDIVGFGADGVWVSLSTGVGFEPNTYWKRGEFTEAQGVSGVVSSRFVTDVTGDGRADIVGFLYDGGYYVAPSTGDAFGTTEFRIRNFRYVYGDRVNILMADVSNDGKVDAVGFRDDGVWLIKSK